MNAASNAIAASADRVLDEIVERALFGTDPIVIAKSPPGAGKTFLVECAAAVAVAHPRARVVIVTPGVSQLYDIGRRLLDYNFPRLNVAHAKHRELPPDLVGRIAATRGWDPILNCGPGVVVTNVHLLAAYLHQLSAGAFDFMIVDEAYQLAASEFMQVAHLAPRCLLVGDPGQLNPVSAADTTNLESGPHKIHWSAPAYVLDRFPGIPVFGLPVTRRLLPDTARLVQAAFYPDLPFDSIVDPRSRQLRFAIAGAERGIDDALDAVASGHSLVGLTLPGSAPAHEEADLDLAALIARVANRVLLRQAEWIGQRRLMEADIGCIDPHVISGGAISDSLRKLNHSGIRVDTVERWQGLQLPISVVRHPLSLTQRPAAFDLEAGRWCVSLSRHQIGCIVVARESTTALIRDYVHGCDTVAAGARDVTWAGFQAHRMIWKTLQDQGRIFSL
jgi:hypothetical protein